MSFDARDPYLDLLSTLTRRGVQFAVLAGSDLGLDPYFQGTLDLALAVDIGAENMTSLVQILAEQGYKFAHQASTPPGAGVPAEVVALTFSRADRPDADLHVVLAPPSSWADLADDVCWRPFGPLAVPALAWELLLDVEDEKKVLARREAERLRRRAQVVG